VSLGPPLPPSQTSRGYAQNVPVNVLHNANKRCDITNKDITVALKWVATVLDYPISKGIPIKWIDTHSLRSGGANALSLAGFSDTQIQKMGRWRWATLKEYVRKELALFSKGNTRTCCGGITWQQYKPLE
jgi:hypothetical protein